MKRLLFVVLLITCSASWAEWELCGATGKGDENTLYFCDTSTIRRNGAISRMWRMNSNSNLQRDPYGDRYMSVKSLWAYNCIDETGVTISVISYSKSMGEGKVVRSVTLKERDWRWGPIVPGSVSETSWKIACGRK